MTCPDARSAHTAARRAADPWSQHDLSPCNRDSPGAGADCGRPIRERSGPLQRRAVELAEPARAPPLDARERPGSTGRQAGPRGARGTPRRAPLTGATMAAVRTVRPIGFDDKLTVVEHLTELRTRLIVCVVAFAAATGLCLWQSHTLLDLLNRPLHQTALQKAAAPNEPEQRLSSLLRQQATVYRSLAPSQRDPGLQAKLAALATQSLKVADATATPAPRRPVTLGVGEPFSVTLKVAAYAGLLLALPVLLYQAFAFLLPALSPRERSIGLPLVIAVPLLFAAGAIFSYLLVLPAAIRFLQGFNSESFETLLQARDYYRFATMLMAAMGLLFQIPVGVIAANRVGVVSSRQLRRGRRYALLAIAVIAMLLPGQDPVTMGLMMAPMYMLYEGSVLCARLLERRD